MSFLPPVVAELRGNITDFSAKMKQASGEFAQSAEGMEQRSAITKQRVGASFAAAGALVTGVGAGLEHLGHTLETQQKALEVAIKNTGQSYDEYAGKISATGQKEEHFGHTQADTDQALATLTMATGDAKKALSDMDLVTELAAKHHTSLADAANTVAKMHAGANRVLKEFGINIKDNTALQKEQTAAEASVQKWSDAHDAAVKKLNQTLEIQHAKTKLTVADHIALQNAQAKVQNTADMLRDAHSQLNDAMQNGAKTMDFATEKAMVMAKVHGLAEAQADTFGGKVNWLKTKVEDYAASLGAKVGPALTMLGPLLLGISGILSVELPAGLAASTAAALPWIAGVAALVAAGYLLYTNWDTVVKFVKNIIGDAWSWIHDHFVQIAAFVALPLVPLVLLAQHWSSVLHGMEAVASGVWGGITGAFHAGVNAIKGAINFLISGINSFIRGIDDIHISVHLPDWLPGIGGKGFDWKGLNIPTIPQLQAGGTAMQGGWADVGEAGRERLFLPPGAQVQPLRSGSPGAGAGETHYHVHVHLDGNVIGNDLRQAGEQLAPSIRDALIRTGFRQQLGLPS